MRLSLSSVGLIAKLSVTGALLAACGDDAPRDDDPFKSPYGKIDGGSTCPAGQYTVGTRCVSGSIDGGALDAAVDSGVELADASSDAGAPQHVVVTP